MGVSENVFEKLMGGKAPEYVKEGWIRKSEEVVGAEQNKIYHYFWGPRAIASVSTLVRWEFFCLDYFSG